MKHVRAGSHAGIRAAAILALVLAGACTGSTRPPAARQPSPRAALEHLRRSGCTLLAEETDLGKDNTVWVGRRGAPEVTVGPEQLLEIFAKLQQGAPIDLRGATGTLDWDRSGDVLQDFDILCVRTSTPSGATAVPLGTKPSGLYYDVRRDDFAGAVTGCPGP